MDSFLFQYELKNLVKDNTCLKSLDNLSCVDLFLTNNVKSFQHTKTISVVVLDCHKMVVTVLKSTYIKQKPRENFDQNKFKEQLRRSLSDNKTSTYFDFERIFLQILDTLHLKEWSHEKNPFFENQKFEFSVSSLICSNYSVLKNIIL